MRPFLQMRLRRLLYGCGAAALLILVTQGCGAKQEEAAGGTPATGASTTAATGQPGAAMPANASDAEMRKSFSQKSFDINNVPPQQRDKVRAMMQQNTGTGPSAPGATGK